MKQKVLLCLLAITFSLRVNTAKAEGEGDAFFAMAQVHDVYINFHQSTYWDSLLAYMPL